MDPPRSPAPALRAGIDVSPMIGVVLTVLMALVALPAFGHLSVTPPATHCLPAQEKRVMLVISDRGGLRLVDGGDAFRVRFDSLGTRLREVYAKRPGDDVLYLVADERASYRHVLVAMEAARSAGVRHVTAITSGHVGARY